MKSLSLIGALLAVARLGQATTCNADNCARAVTGTLGGMQSSRLADCSSYLRCTTTGSIVVVTSTSTLTAAASTIVVVGDPLPTTITAFTTPPASTVTVTATAPTVTTTATNTQIRVTVPVTGSPTTVTVTAGGAPAPTFKKRGACKRKPTSITLSANTTTAAGTTAGTSTSVVTTSASSSSTVPSTTAGALTTSTLTTAGPTTVSPTTASPTTSALSTTTLSTITTTGATCPTAIPSYASACSGTARYTSACSCAGITRSTVTVGATTVTVVAITAVTQPAVTITSIPAPPRFTTFVPGTASTTTVTVTPTPSTATVTVAPANPTISVTANIPGPTVTVTVTVTPTPTPPASCNNQGLQYALWKDYAPEANWLPENDKNETPYAIGVTNYLSADNGFSIYNQANGDGNNFAVIHRGYIYAPETGTYTFTGTNVDDHIDMWIGPLAYSGWTRSNAQQDIALDAGTFTIDLVAGQYYPFRMAVKQVGGPFSFLYSVTAPSGLKLIGSDARTSPSGYVVQFSCDGRAPIYAPFGQET